jgi:hypothetical protein
MPAPGDNLTAKLIRGVAWSFWRSVAIKKKEKEAWKDLQRTRHSDPSVYEKGLKLLKKQGHIAKLKANFKQIVNTAVAEPFQSGPAHPKAAEIPTVSSGDIASAQTDPDRSSSFPKSGLSQQTSAVQPRSKDLAGIQSASRRSPSLVARPGSKDIANAQSISDRSFSSPEFILSKHTTPERTPVAQPGCKDTAIEPSDPSDSPMEFELPEHTLAAHPRSTSTHTTPNRPSSSSSLEHTMAAHPGSKDDARTSEKSSSPPTPAAFEQVSTTHPMPKTIVMNKSNSHPCFTPPFPR